MSFLTVMRQRGAIAQITHEEELEAHLQGGMRSAYAGFDPSAESLHVGHLIPIMALRRWQAAGHRPIVVLGGGTVAVGDPTGKSEMRPMLNAEAIARNTAAFRVQLNRALDFGPGRSNAAIMVDNATWLNALQYLPFLRDVGRHFSVNRMLTAESFRQRMERGLSFLEFNYMVLQAYDFLHLFRTEGCTVQLGGDDQWSNMLSGVELVRRMCSGSSAYCVTVPLLTTSSGTKMGKTEKGAVWLDPAKTSAYEFYQFWRNVEDARVRDCLLWFTDLPPSTVDDLVPPPGASDRPPRWDAAKNALAREITALWHGAAAAEQAAAAARALFGGVAGSGGATASGGGDVPGAPAYQVERWTGGGDRKIVDLLVESGAFASKGEVRRLIEQGGLAVGGQKVDNIDETISTSTLEQGGGVLVRKGKKHYFRLCFSG